MTRVLTLLVAGLILLGVGCIGTQNPGGKDSIFINVGESRTIEKPPAFRKASVENPEVADFLITSTTQISLTGKSKGVTTLTIWGRDNEVREVVKIIVK